MYRRFAIAAFVTGVLVAPMAAAQELYVSPKNGVLRENIFSGKLSQHLKASLTT